MDGASEVMGLFQYLHHVDKDLTLAVNSWNSPVGDFIWQVFSDKQIWFILYLAVAVFLIRNLGWKRGLIVIASVILTIVCCDQFANFTKSFFQRLRPCKDGDMIAGGLHILEGCGKKNIYGFYSAHAANAIGFAVSTISGFSLDKSRDYGIYDKLIVFWALCVGISRVFVGKHFLGDVAAGFVVGLLVAWAMAAIAKAVINRMKI